MDPVTCDCGGAPGVYSSKDSTTGSVTWQVTCTLCGIQGQSDPSRDTAIQNWNNDQNTETAA